MGLGNIQQKSAAMGKEKSSIMKINMYENPQMALDLIAHICTASRDLDVDHCFDAYFGILDDFEKRINDKGFTLYKPELVDNCRSGVNYLVLSLLADVSANIKVAVAGGYSAGKSSLLNSLTGIGHLLPTGIDPVSMVNTHINCSSSTRNLIVRGENIKNDVVLLNKDVLACVQHASKSKVYIASVLNKIIMDVPTPSYPYLNGITFVDTPGYNNSNSSNVENKAKDVETAIEAIKDADVLFWCIDIDAGTITNNDLQMLKHVQHENENMPIVIFFTKMDKKPDSEVDKIMKAASLICQKELVRMPDDIIGISCVDDKVKMKSLNNHSMSQLFKILVSANGTSDYLQIAENAIGGWFDEEMNSSKVTTDNYENKRQESIKEKNEWQELYNSTKQENNEEMKHIRDVVLASYDKIMNAANLSYESFQKALEGWSDSLDREVEWSNESGLFSSTSSLERRYQSSINKYNSLIHVDCEYQYWVHEHREDLCNRVQNLLNKTLEEINQYREQEEENCKNLVNGIQEESNLRALLNEYRPKILRSLQECYNNCKNIIRNHMNKLQELPVDDDIDIFSAIHGDNFKRFLGCFSNGVDITKCDSEGYSPLTLACRMGNNEMVKFFIEHDADLARKDNRGYNALETAAIFNYRDICDMLIKADKTLVSQSRSLVELSKKNTFTDWISKF